MVFIYPWGSGGRGHPHSHPAKGKIGSAPKGAGPTLGESDGPFCPPGHRPLCGEQAQPHQPLPCRGASCGEVCVRLSIQAYPHACVCQPTAGPVLSTLTAEQAGGKCSNPWGERHRCCPLSQSHVGSGLYLWVSAASLTWTADFCCALKGHLGLGSPVTFPKSQVEVSNEYSLLVNICVFIYLKVRERNLLLGAGCTLCCDIQKYLLPLLGSSWGPHTYG